ncbi:MAG: RraA family protein [Planctomycetia bacterium]
MTTPILDDYLAALPKLYSAVLADVLDELGHRRQVLPMNIRPLSLASVAFGRVRTLTMRPVDAVPEKPYALEMKAIDDLKPHDVLVIEMNGCPECAVWGELLATAAKARQAGGVVMNGATRDSGMILEVGFPTFATGFTPLDSKGRIDGTAWDVPVTIGEASLRPGDFILGDRDGVVVVPQEAAVAALQAALQKISGENTVREELVAGESVAAVFARHGVL